MIKITPSISIDENEIEEHFIRAPGPGGQKVNKTESAVQLRFDARHCSTLPNADIDFDNNIWSIPAAMNKSGRPHNVPLAVAAVKIIQSIPRAHDVFVFPARGRDNPISGFSKWKRRLDDLSGTDDWTIHDIRRTVATGLAKLKVEPYIVERILNHTSGTFGGVTGIYNRFGYMDEMREALTSWSEYLNDII